MGPQNRCAPAPTGVPLRVRERSLGTRPSRRPACFRWRKARTEHRVAQWRRLVVGENGAPQTTQSAVTRLHRAAASRGPPGMEPGPRALSRGRQAHGGAKVAGGPTGSRDHVGESQCRRAGKRRSIRRCWSIPHTSRLGPTQQHLDYKASGGCHTALTPRYRPP